MRQAAASKVRTNTIGLHLTNTVNCELTNSQFDTRMQAPKMRSRVALHHSLRPQVRPTTRKPG